MHLHEPCFDLDELFRMNYHIHSNLSRCAKPEMQLSAIIEAAEKAGLKEIAIVDHIQPLASRKLYLNTERLEAERKHLSPSLKVYIGAELSAYGVNKYSLKYSNIDTEYRLYSHNHYHCKTWEQPQDLTPEGYKEHSKAVMKSIIMSSRADCLAHPFTDGYIVKKLLPPYYNVKGCVTKQWSDNEIGDMLALGKSHNVAWELNTKALIADCDFAKRYFSLGREIGVCFNAGTDAHVLADINPEKYLELLRKILF